MTLRVKNWHKFQHFKDRSPPWIKLYRDLLDDMEWHELDAEAAKALVSIWLIASEKDGELPDMKKLAFRMRMSVSCLESIVSQLYHWLEHDDINPISERYQDDTDKASKPNQAVDKTIALTRSRETEKEREKEVEVETEKKATTRAPRKSSTAPAPDRPDDVSEQTWNDWVALRKSKKATVSETVIAEARAESVKAGLSLERFLAVWCLRGSQGLSADWLKPSERGQGGPPIVNRQEAQEARNRAAADEWLRQEGVAT